MRGLFKAFLNRNEQSVEIGDNQEGYSNPFTGLRDNIKERSARFKAKNIAGEISFDQYEGLTPLQKVSRRVKLALRIIPKEEFVLTRYHPHLVRPF